jgi:hypothetical protein
MSGRLSLLGLTAFILSCCVPALCDKRPVAEFIGKLSINGIVAEDSDASSGPRAGVRGNPFVSAPSIKNGPPPGALNWTASMPAPATILSKRAEPQPRRYGPLWPQGNNCVFCPEPPLLEVDALTLVRQLTPQKMKTYMRGTPADLHNRCVFYTRAEDRLSALSGAATEFACLYNKYSIWVGSISNLYWGHLLRT